MQDMCQKSIFHSMIMSCEIQHNIKVSVHHHFVTDIRYNMHLERIS